MTEEEFFKKFKTVNLLKAVSLQLNNYKGLVSEVIRLLREYNGDLEKTNRPDLFTNNVFLPVYLKVNTKSHDCKSSPAVEKLK